MGTYKTYIIHVNGQRYEVTVEEKGGAASVTGVTPAPAPAAVALPPAAAPAVTALPSSAAAANKWDNGNTVTAPMPGKVVAIKVKPGTQLKEGQVLLILEAMKMENEIIASSTGTVKEVYVSEGTSVNVGEPLVAII